MDPILISQKSLESVPWKNGLGVTQQIAIWPATARFPQDAFDWRLSSAVIKKASPFSVFPGYDRSLILIEGKSLHWRSGPGEGGVLVPGKVLEFSGEEQIRCEIPDGPVKDFGVIYHRDRIQAELNAIEWKIGRPVQKISTEFLALFVISGSIEIEAGAAQYAPKMFKLQSGDTLLMRSGDRYGPASGSGEGLVAIVEIDPFQ